MPSTPHVLVIGSTGNVGTATIRALSANGVATRAGVRDTTSVKATELDALDHITVSSPPITIANIDGTCACVGHFGENPT